MGHILLLCRSGPAADRVLSYRLPIELRRCSSAEHVPRLARELETLAILADLADDGDAPSAPIIAAIRAHDAELPIVLWCPAQESGSSRFIEACRAGVTGVLFQTHGAFEQYALTQLVPRGAMTFIQWVEATLQRAVPGEARNIVDLCLHRASTEITVPQIAKHLGLARRRLTEHLTRVGLPPASTLLEWGKLLRAAWDLEHSDLTIERIALDHGYASASALRSALKRRTGDGPRQLRVPGGFGWVLRCFDHHLTSTRRKRAVV
jgi:AraC-like DNA-binding protein